jgi:apolipoprotein N-acyltransferase
MSTALAEVPRRTRPSLVTRERSIDEIISSARRRPVNIRGAFLPCALTSLLLWCSFTPLDFGPLAWVALVPLLQLVRIPRMTFRSYVTVWLGACLFTFPALQWMRLGDPSMYIAWFALASYIGLYFPVFVGLTRVATRILPTPMWLVAPLIWVGLEYVRAHLITGFPWYFLGHTQYRWTAIVQVSDLVGAYGVSLVVAMVNAAVATLVPMEWLGRLGLIAPDDREQTLGRVESKRSIGIGVGVALAVVVAAVSYGVVRIDQAEFKSGPRIALVQGNFTTSLKHDPDAWEDIYTKHRTLSGMTVSQQPDIIVWPETMFRIPLFLADDSYTDQELDALIPQVPAARWRDRIVQNELAKLSGETNAALIIGVDTMVAKKGGYDHLNSATLVTPQNGLEDRYDKLHRVPFGEYIPLRETLPFLKSLTPFGDDFGLTAGTAVHVFSVKDWRLLPLICFEDTVPHLVRSMTETASEEKPVDVLVNLTNDGWFHGSSELNQHLITASFRCIENRKPMVRAVNTGISAFIDGNGQVRDPSTVIDLDAMLDRDRKPRTTIRDPETGEFYKQWNAAFIADVPLDSRTSLYARGGDWFAASCATLCILLLIVGLLKRPPVRPVAA